MSDVKNNDARDAPLEPSLGKRSAGLHRAENQNSLVQGALASSRGWRLLYYTSSLVYEHGSFADRHIHCLHAYVEGKKLQGRKKEGLESEGSPGVS